MTVKVAINIAVVVIALVGSLSLFWADPSLQPTSIQTTEILLPRVQTEQVSLGSHRPVWAAGGRIEAGEVSELSSAVSGVVEFVELDYVQGMTIPEGTLLMSLEKTPLTIAQTSARADVELAEAELAMELGKHQLALAELKLLKRQKLANKSLATRQPQLKIAYAKLAQSKARLDLTSLNLKLSDLVMPYTGRLLAVEVGRGASITPGQALFQVVNPKSIRLRAKMSINRLALLDKTADAFLISDNIEQEIALEFLAVSPEIDARDQQIQVIFGLKNPALTAGAVMLNQFVRVRITGKSLAQTYELSRSALSNENLVWWVDTQHRLQRYEADIAHRGPNTVLVRMPHLGRLAVVLNPPMIVAPGMLVEPQLQTLGASL